MTLICLLIFLIPISTVTLTGKRLIEETLADIDYVCSKDQTYRMLGTTVYRDSHAAESASSEQLILQISSPKIASCEVSSASGSAKVKFGQQPSEPLAESASCDQ